MTIAYILGDGSKYNNLELRISLRSAEKYLNPKKVIVCGHDPGFLSDKVTYIPNYPVKKDNDAAFGIKENLLALCKSDLVPDEFTLLNDDYFFLAPMTDFPYYHKGELRAAMERIGSGIFYGHLLATAVVLEKKGLSTKHFDCHWPIIYNKKKLLKIIEEQNWDVPLGPTIRSLYCNTLGIEGQYIDDVKINKPVLDWESATANMPMISVGDEAFDRICRSYFISLYPNSSVYEK